MGGAWPVMQLCSMHTKRDSKWVLFPLPFDAGVGEEVEFIDMSPREKER
jgi:hypothetical protein